MKKIYNLLESVRNIILIKYDFKDHEILREVKLNEKGDGVFGCLTKRDYPCCRFRND